MYLINPTQEKISNGLEEWSWLPINDKTPIVVTAFGDIFFESSNGIWFLDTLEGNISKVTNTRGELQDILNTVEGQDHFLMSGFVDRAVAEGMKLMGGQCYNFKISPVLGGQIIFENIEIQDLVVALSISGQIHRQVKDLPAGTKINNINISD